MAVCLIALVATSPAEAAGRYKTVTKTFSSLGMIQTPNSSIADRSSLASPYASALSVAGLRQGRVLNVNLQINAYGHACAEDLDVLLVGPSGRNAVVMSDMPGCTNVQNVNLTFDDEGASAWPVPLVSGAYVPTDNDAQGLDAFLPPPRAAGPRPRRMEARRSRPLTARTRTARGTSTSWTTP